jgi:hypothetical protein
MGWPNVNGKARISATRPEAKGICDRCGAMYSLADLGYQYQWAGVSMTNLQLRVCSGCMDTPQIQLKSFVIPPDPVPVLDPRVEFYGIEVTSFLQSEEGPSLLTEDGQALLWEIEVTPNNDPNLPVLIP